MLGNVNSGYVLVPALWKGMEKKRGGEEKTRTGMVQMLAKLHIPVPSRRNVEVALHFIPLQTPIHPTRLPLAPDPRRLAELAPPLALRQHVVHMLFLLHLETPLAVQPMHPLRVNPLLPIRRIPLQQVARQDPIT